MKNIRSQSSRGQRKEQARDSACPGLQSGQTEGGGGSRCKAETPSCTIFISVGFTQRLPNTSRCTKEEWCTGGDNVKDNGVFQARSTEQGASASQMSAAKSGQVPGEANDAVSAYTQVRMKDASKQFRAPDDGMPTSVQRVSSYSSSDKLGQH